MNWTKIRSFREYLEDKNIKVILFEELVSYMERTLAEVFKFLGVDPDFRIDRGMARQNKSEGKSIYNPAVTWFRRAVPAGIRARLPVDLRRRVRDRIAGLTGPTFDHSDLSPEEVTEIRRQLDPEVSALYEYRGIDDDPWAFFAESSHRHSTVASRHAP